MKEISHYTKRILHNLDILEIFEKKSTNNNLYIDKLRSYMHFLDESNINYNKISSLLSDLDLDLRCISNSESSFLIYLIKQDLIHLKIICINKAIKDSVLSLNMYIRENQHPLTILEVEHFETFKEEDFFKTFENENKNLKNKEIVEKLYLIIVQLFKEFKELKKSIEI